MQGLGTFNIGVEISKSRLSARSKPFTRLRSRPPKQASPRGVEVPAWNLDLQRTMRVAEQSPQFFELCRQLPRIQEEVNIEINVDGNGNIICGADKEQIPYKYGWCEDKEGRMVIMLGQHTLLQPFPGKGDDPSHESCIVYERKGADRWGVPPSLAYYSSVVKSALSGGKYYAEQDVQPASPPQPSQPTSEVQPTPLPEEGALPFFIGDKADPPAGFFEKIYPSNRVHRLVEQFQVFLRGTGALNPACFMVQLHFWQRSPRKGSVGSSCSCPTAIKLDMLVPEDMAAERVRDVNMAQLTVMLSHRLGGATSYESVEIRPDPYVILLEHPRPLFLELENFPVLAEQIELKTPQPDIHLDRPASQLDPNDFVLTILIESINDCQCYTVACYIANTVLEVREALAKKMEKQVEKLALYMDNGVTEGHDRTKLGDEVRVGEIRSIHICKLFMLTC
jgi:hypothetical protein